MLQLNSKRTGAHDAGARIDLEGTCDLETRIGDGKREIRSFSIQEFRMEEEGGKRYFTGYAAPYNSLSADLGGWYERIMPGAFTRALAEKNEVHHLVNHNENMILGNTAAGTTQLSEDSKGLRFKTLIGTRSYEKDLVESMERKDIQKCSFAFIATKQDWIDEPDPAQRGAKRTVRELRDLNLFDVSIVSRPAYSDTNAELSSRSMFPDGVPDSIASRMKPNWLNAKLKPKADGDEPGVCMCDCSACVAGACADCANMVCDDENCRDCPMQMKAATAAAPKAQVAPVRDPAVHARTLTAARLATQRDMAKPIELRSAVKGDGALEMLVYDDIGASCFGGGVTAEGMKRQIEAAEPHTKIRLRINSFGGDAFEGITIGNYLKSVGKPIEVCVDGLAASAASVVAMCGDTISMAPNAMMMIHNASSGVYGYAAEMRKEADVLDKCSKAIGQTYVTRTGKSATAVKDIMDAETWMTAKECVKEGFATMVASPKPDPDPDGDDDSARFLEAARESRWMELYRNVPEHLKPETRDKKLAEQRAAKTTAAEKEERERIEIRRRRAAASLTV